MKRRRNVQYTRNALFHGIPAELLDVKKLVRSRASFDAGEIIFDEGDRADFCYLVGSGCVRISKALPDGSQELLATIEPGEFFGELALYDSTTRSARATAAVPSRLGLVDQEGFDYLRSVAPYQLASTLAESSIERVRQTNLLLISELGAAGRLSNVGYELGAMAHNLRSPLSTIRNAADLLQQWLANGSHDARQTARFVEIIRRTANTGLGQIDQLMRRVRGEIHDDRQEISVEELLEELRELTAGYVSDPLIRYRQSTGSSSISVKVDRTEFLAVLCNIVKNAVEALPAGGGEIEVSVSNDATSVTFVVSDTGAGIPPEHIPRLFERSFSAGKSGGTGLGLCHARSVVEGLGGSIGVKSEVGRGTSVQIQLPLPSFESV